MLHRQIVKTLIKRHEQSLAVILLGSRQVGKTTLARNLAWRLFSKPMSNPLYILCGRAS